MLNLQNCFMYFLVLYPMGRSHRVDGRFPFVLQQQREASVLVGG